MLFTNRVAMLGTSCDRFQRLAQRHCHSVALRSSRSGPCCHVETRGHAPSTLGTSLRISAPTHSNKHNTSRQAKAQYIPQSQPKADWLSRAPRSVYNYWIASSGNLARFSKDKKTQKASSPPSRASPCLDALKVEDKCFAKLLVKLASARQLVGWEHEVAHVLCPNLQREWWRGRLDVQGQVSCEHRRKKQIKKQLGLPGSVQAIINGQCGDGKPKLTQGNTPITSWN